MSEYCGDGEPVSVHAETRLRARVPHQCDACKETVTPGHEYVKEVVIYDGCVEVTKRCIRCQAMYEHLCDVSADDHAPNPRLDCGHGYAEVHDEPPPDAIAALAFMTADEQDALVTRAKRARTRR